MSTVKVETYEQPFNMIASIHTSGAVVIGMRGPFMMFNSTDDAADYLQDFVDSFRRHSGPVPTLEAGDKAP